MIPKTSKRQLSGRTSAGTTPSALSRRQLLQAGGSLVGAAAAGAAAPTWAFGSENAPGGRVEIENLGPGNVAFPVIGGLFVPETQTMYLGSRNLAPSRVVGFHVPSGEVTRTYTLGTGRFVMGLASGGADVLYAATGSGSQDQVNLFRCDVPTGDVTGIGNVQPGLNIRDITMSPDGVLFIAGRPQGPNEDPNGPALFSYDPASGDITNHGYPDPNAESGRSVAATETTVYLGAGSQLGRDPDASKAGLFAVDRETGEISDNLLPPVLAEDDEVINVEVLGDVVAVGTIAHEGDTRGHAGILNLADGSWWVLDMYGREFIRYGDELLVWFEDALRKLDVETQTVTHVVDVPPIEGSGVAWAIGLIDDLLVAGIAGGYVWTYDLASGDNEVHDLIEAGGDGDPQRGMSVGVLDGHVYVGGTQSVDLHDVSTGSVRKLFVRGEVKDMIPAGDVMYMGVYSGFGIFEHRPTDEHPPRKVADLPDRQNRPHGVRWDDVNELLVLAVEADTLGSGSMVVFDPTTGEVTAHIDPLGTTSVRSVATGHGLAYIGGGNGDVAAWDPLAGEQVWRMSRPVGRNLVTGLVVIGHRLFGVTGNGNFFVIDLARGPELVHEADLGSFARNARLVVNRGLIYGQSSTNFFRIFPFARYRHEVLADVSGDWFSGPRLAVGDGNYHYTLDGRDLVRIRDRTPRA